MSTSEQARADAMADAETLVRYVADHSHGRYNRTTLSRAANRDWTGAAYWRTPEREHVAAERAVAAARAAFRAVSALRGER